MSVGERIFFSEALSEELNAELEELNENYFFARGIMHGHSVHKELYKEYCLRKWCLEFARNLVLE